MPMDELLEVRIGSLVVHDDVQSHVVQFLGEELAVVLVLLVGVLALLKGSPCLGKQGWDIAELDAEVT